MILCDIKAPPTSGTSVMPCIVMRMMRWIHNERWRIRCHFSKSLSSAKSPTFCSFWSVYTFFHPTVSFWFFFYWWVQTHVTDAFIFHVRILNVWKKLKRKHLWKFDEYYTKVIEKTRDLNEVEDKEYQIELIKRRK